MTDKPNIVLIHGAWGQAACWGRVPALLRQEGFTIWTPDLAGHATHETADPSIDLATYADGLTELVMGLDNPILVGHSMGGMVISTLAQRAPEKIAHLIYLAAFLPGDGDSLMDLKKREPDTIGPAVQPGPVAGTTILGPDRAADYLFHDADEQQKRAMLQLLRPQSNAAQTQNLRVTANGLDTVSKSYVMCMDDRTVTPDLQLRMAQDGAIDDILSLQTGHYPQVTAPQRLSDMITAICHRKLG